MSGHSKWSTIKHKKAATDSKRGKAFTRLAKEVTIASRAGGGDLATNPALRLAVDKARAANMPKDNIERAIKRGTGELEGGELYESMYEGYTPHGIGILVEVVTDNKNRAVAEVRHVLSKYGGSMAEVGSVAWQFTRKGYIEVLNVTDEDEIFLIAADAGADDIDFVDGNANIYSVPENMQGVRTALEDAGLELSEAQLIYDPNNAMTLEQKKAMQVMRVIDAMEDLDDVQNIYSALDITDEMMAAMDE